jgi:adenylate kinase
VPAPPMITRQLNLILLGPPGAGKGTQAERIRKQFQLPHIATGDMLRAHVREKTELGRRAAEFMDAGDLVSDELILEMARDRLQREDAQHGFLLDGFPRTVAQADALETMLAALSRQVLAAIHIDVPDWEVIRRLSGRRVCVDAGHNYHVEFDPPRRNDICDHDGSLLLQRDDDKPDVVKHRLVVYHEKTGPLIGYFRDRGTLREIDGTKALDEVNDQILSVMEGLSRVGGV